MRIVIFWDSITEGFWDLENWGWVNRLKTYFWKKSWYDIIVMNYWISAYTSDNILKIFQSFFDWCSRREKWKEKESTIMVAIWINDCSINKNTNLPRVNKEKFEEKLNNILDKCKKDELIKKVVFVSNINVNEEIINNDDWDFLFFNDEIKKYNSVIKTLCDKEKIDYIDLFWIINNDELEDWLHPNNKWHQKIFEKIRDFLEK